MAFSAGLLLLFFWQLDPGDTFEALRDANYIWLIPALALYFLAVFFRALRWRFLLMHIKSVPAIRLYSPVVVGYMANNLLPVRLGEFVRAWFFSEREGVSKSAALGTVLLERVFDGVGLLIIALLVWPFLDVSEVFSAFSDDIGIPEGALIGLILALFLGVLVLMFGVALFSGMRDAVVNLLLRFLPQRVRAPAQRVLYSFVDGLSGLRNPKRVALILIVTMPVWLAEGAMYHIIGWAFDLGVPYNGSLFITAIANLAVSLPSAPGGIGPFEYATKVVLEGFNESSEVAAAYAVILHAALLAPVTALGLFFMWLHNLSFSEMTRRSSEVVAPEPGEDDQPSA